jgi:regulator of sigma E protease
MSGPLAIVAFVVALVLCVLIHELGHLLTAKVFGMRADRYFVGFGPTLWSTRRGETEYGLKAFPLGGFVAIRGMTPLDERRRGIVDDLFDPQRLAVDRASVGASARAPSGAGPGNGEVADRGPAGGVDTSLAPNVPEATFTRLTAMLEERGTPPELVERIDRRLRAVIGPASTVADARSALTEVLTTELEDSRRVGDLPHRLRRGDEERFYHDRPIWQRAITIATGPITHLGLVLVLLFGIYALVALPTGEATTEVAALQEGSAADVAGLQPGDVILAVDDVASDDFLVLRDALRERPGQPTTLLVEREAEVIEVDLVLGEQIDEDTGEVQGVAGFNPAPAEERLSASQALVRASVGDEVIPLGGVVPILGASVEGLINIFSPQGLASLASTALGTQERDPEAGVSLVGAASLAGQASGDGSAGLVNFVFLLASINVFFFIFNMVPLPPFDGGHLAVLVIEKGVNLTRRARGRQPDFTVDPRAITAVMLPVLGVLGFVLIALLWLDIVDPIQIG